MSKFDYTNLSATSARLINRFGRNLKKRTITNSGTEWNPTQTATDTDIDGVIVAYGLDEIDGTLIMTTDKKLLTTSAVELDDKIVDGSTVYAVVSVSVVEPGDTKLLYKVQLRN